LDFLHGQEFILEDCEDDMTTGVTKFDLQKLQSPCCETLDTSVTENDEVGATIRKDSVQFELVLQEQSFQTHYT
jgi:hypothetical protein